MSSTEQMDEVCASCGITQGDDTKLKTCACKLVRYCSVDCQKNHRSKHKKACKQQMAKLRDDLLMEQPDSTHHGDCEICCLPLPLDGEKFTMMTCCGKAVCRGCEYANKLREYVNYKLLCTEEVSGWTPAYLGEMGGMLEHKCMYCRQRVAQTEEEIHQFRMKRVEANDPSAMYHMGAFYYYKEDFDGALECFEKAAELRHADAHYFLAGLYDRGQGVEKDEKKKLYHLEEAAIRGHPDARCNLGCYEGQSGRHDRAMRHFIIAAKLGHFKAMANVTRGCVEQGLVSPEDYVATLRVYQAAVDATKSVQREKAYAEEIRGYHSR